MIRPLYKLKRRFKALFSPLLAAKPSEDPIRSELFSIERFDQHAFSLAAAQTITRNPKSGIQLTPRLRENEKILQEAFRYLTNEVQKKKPINPSGEWLIDSFYVVEEQLRDIKRYLPHGFYNELPKLSKGFLQGHPRVYGLAWAYVAHTDSRFDSNSLTHFVKSYQQVQPLTIGELWALAVTLRVVMIENLRRIAIQVVTAQEARREADAFVDEVLGVTEESTEEKRPSPEKMRLQSVHPAFLVQLIQRLLYQDPAGTPAVTWLNERLAAEKKTAEELVTAVYNLQAANNLTVRNIITSFRSMMSFDWQEFVEKVSLVHETLLKHPGFDQMDFMTRNHYRSAVEEIARGAKKSELEIAHLAVSKAEQAARKGGPSQRVKDPGYFLFAEGRRDFEKEVGYRVSLQRRTLRFYTNFPTFSFIVSLLLMTGAFLAVPLSMDKGPSSIYMILLALFGLFPAAELAVSWFNRFIAEIIPPGHLSRLELLQGPPEDRRTFVVVPTLLGVEEEIAEQFEKLEVHYLSNPEGDVRFALLTDWKDSDTETAPEDAKQLRVAGQLLAALNLKHGPAPGGGPRFFFFHRKRLWNPVQRKWMGWERKRGKLHEFYRVLQGATDTTYFNADNSPVTAPRGVRYVVTLDSDTKLPPAVVTQLVGILAHPLNQARLDPQTRKVVEGYGILQPRVTSFLPKENEKSIFQELFSGECGIDPYASAVSDVYQDLFGEGNFTGKGIIDIDAYEQALEGRIPENSLLSHDLFEGSFLRSGYASDLEFFEEFPSHAEISTVRNHRWIRGDWQLLPWIFGREAAVLSLISRWKMLDNLRRSLTPVGTVALVVSAFCIPDADPFVWVGLALMGIAIPPFVPFFEDIAFWRKPLHWKDQVHETLRHLRLGIGHFTVNLVLLANRAWMHLDAIARTLWRLFVTHRDLLEWVTAAQAKSAASLTLSSFWRRMMGSVSIGLLTAALTYLFNPRAFPLCVPFVLLWLSAPWFARLISLPLEEETIQPLSAPETQILRLYGRRVWRFFTTYTGAEDHFLPPDNFQEDPEPVVAHRSSPTNFGLYLLSVVTAHDFGWCALTEMTDRLEAAFRSLKALPRYRGHFYNWYDTRSLQVLNPQYVSSVDSGNLAGHLLTLSQSCRDILNRPLFSQSTLAGIKDSTSLLKQALQDMPPGGRTNVTSLSQLQTALLQLEDQLVRVPETFWEWSALWDKLLPLAETLKDISHASASDHGGMSKSEVIVWAGFIVADIKSHGADFHRLFPWASLLSRPTLLPPGTTEETDGLRSLQGLLTMDLNLGEMPDRCQEAVERFEAWRQSRDPSKKSVQEDVVFDQVADALVFSAEACGKARKRLEAIAETAHQLFKEMDFSFLLNPKKKLFSIGYRVPEEQLDESCYDLLASEARLTSYVAIIKGDVPVSHWFRLGRGLIADEKGAILLSWSGSMFEYLMPYLVMPTPEGSLLDQTCKRVVQRQIQYGHDGGVPWGASESGYNVRDLDLIYQYSNFGVPGLGLKRGLGKDVVIAPYATALASMVSPHEALENLEKLESIGARGPFGFYEALDYTPTRLMENQKFAVVRSYMAHHQGMSLLSFSNAVHDGLLRRRFHMDPLVQAGELLLQERTPRSLGALRDQMKEVEIANVKDVVSPVLRRIRSPHHPVPSSHLLSNGRYAVMITAAGSGYSLWKNRAVTRWREDVTRDHYGSYIYLRDLKSSAVWSAAYQPTLVHADQSQVVFSEDRAKISRTDHMISTDLEVLVSAEDDAELRRVSLTNHSDEAVEIEITSYCEVVIAPQDSDIAHPAFSNLFIQTEYIPQSTALVAARRPRSEKDEHVYMAQVLSWEGEPSGAIEYETDRSQFIGRGRTLRKPISVMDGRSLSNTTGAVLDPVLSLRIRVKIQPGTTAKVCFTTLVAPNGVEALAMAEKYHNSSAFERSSSLVWTQSKAKLHHLGIDVEEAQLFQKLANRVLYSDPLMRPTSEILKRNRMNVTGLWARGISGDLPILLVRIDDLEELGLIRQLLRAHEYWRMKRLAVDIVILNEKSSSYVQDLQNTLEGLVRGSEATSGGNPDLPPSKIFVLRNDLLDAREKDLLLTVAKAILNSRQGTLAEQVLRVRKLDSFKLVTAKKLDEVEVFRLQSRAEAPLTVPPLEFFNGIGGFANNGKEYVVVLEKGQRTPAPWINVIANPGFGFHVSESGAGYTWAVNSRENQITGWSNDPVIDPAGEAFFLSDLVTGQVWSPTASPIRLENATYMIRHGAGYSVFENGSNEIYSQLTQFVPKEDSVKISKLVLENRSRHTRKISVTGYVEWVLGFSRSKTAPYIITEHDNVTGALFATNRLNTEFGNRVSFMDFRGAQTSFTADRSEFLGRNGGPERPAALLRKESLSGATGAGLDPCGVLQMEIELAPGEKKELAFFLGQADSPEAARELIQKARKWDLTAQLQTVTQTWNDLLGKIQVQTPDRALDIMLNHWLLYQTIVCRFWARSAFYQAGGAIGFRDQLQDVMAILTTDPKIARNHILQAAARQFVEGDVQHWWHPPTGRGVRTHFADDLLWLPYVVHHYCEATGDQSILEELVPFIEGPRLNPGQEDSYFQPEISREPALSLYEHCARTLDISLQTGVHGLPLMGGGDWNDGMNRVGQEGKGESVWLAWFLHDVLTKMAPVAAQRGETEREELWLEHTHKLKTALEKDGWDGQWYRRAFFDDGTPLGSNENEECQIDSIAQSWAVLSGAGDPARALQAMRSMEDRLINKTDSLALLFTPPFNHTPKDPGYIKGYLPGVRENGGQYTHAAAWSVCAYAKLGLGGKAFELFSMLNPIHHALTRTNVSTYKVEPYVIAADIYGHAPHVGRGGWTWYTGSSGWMVRAGLEFILGIQQHGSTLWFDPCIPKEWAGFKATYQYGSSLYKIQFENPGHVSKGVQRVELDGEAVKTANAAVELKDDQKNHFVKVVMWPIEANSFKA